MKYITVGVLEEMLDGFPEDNLIWFKSSDEYLEEVEVYLHASKGILYVSLGEYGEPTYVKELRDMLAEVSDKDLSINFDTAEVLYACSTDIVITSLDDYGIEIEDLS